MASMEQMEGQAGLFNDEAAFKFRARDIWRKKGTAKHYRDWWPIQRDKLGFCLGVDYRPDLVRNPQGGRPLSEHFLTARAADILSTHSTASGPEHTAAKHDALQAIHAIAVPPAPMPTHSQALRGWADALDALEAARPAVEFVERYVEAKGSQSIRQVAHIVGIPEREFIARLLEDGVLYRPHPSGDLMPYQSHIAAGRFATKTGEANGRAFAQTRFTPRGIEWATKQYGGA